jgi:hypothetical protein
MRGGRGSFLDFVRKQDAATTAVASIEDAAEYGERADALISGLLGRVMRQRRTVGAAMDYIRALSRETRANCWELASRPIGMSTGSVRTFPPLAPNASAAASAEAT